MLIHVYVKCIYSHKKTYLHVYTDKHIFTYIFATWTWQVVKQSKHPEYWAHLASNIMILPYYLVARKNSIGDFVHF